MSSLRMPHCAKACENMARGGHLGEGRAPTGTSTRDALPRPAALGLWEVSLCRGSQWPLAFPYGFPSRSGQC